MKRSKVLIVDAIINLGLGVLLILFPIKLVQFIGVPLAQRPFYASILGAVLVGIGVALLLEYYRPPGGMVGLGLGGAVSINLCAGVVLAAWLMSGKLKIPIRGQVFLWTIVVILVVISGIELLVHLKRQERS